MDAITDKNLIKVPNIHDGRTLLHLAASENDLKLCKRLITDGADVNPLMKTSLDTYMTPYDIAVSKNATECAKYLKSKGGENGEAIAEKAANVIKAKMKLHSARNAANKRAAANEKEGEEKEKEDSTPNRSKKPSKQSQEKEKPAETAVDSEKALTKNKKSNSSDAAANNGTSTSKKPSVQESSKSSMKKKHSDHQAAGTMNSKPSVAVQTKKDSLQDNQAKKKSDYRNKSAQTLISSTEKKLVMVSSSSTSVNSIDSVSSKEQETMNNPKASKDSKPSIDKSRKPPTGTVTTKPKNQNALPSIPPSKSDQAKNSTSKNKTSDRSSSKPNNEPARKPSAENTRRSNLKRAQLVNERPADLSRLKKPQSLPKIESSKKPAENSRSNKPSKTYEPKMEVYEDDFENDLDDEPVAPKNSKYDREFYHSSAKQSFDRTPRSSAQKGQSKRKPTEKSSAFTPKQGARNTLSGTSKRSRSNEEAFESRGRNYGFDWIEEDNMVRVIIRNDEFTSPGRNGFKRYGNAFDRQRLILRSLYDIRRSRINNRDVSFSFFAF